MIDDKKINEKVWYSYNKVEYDGNVSEFIDPSSLQWIENFSSKYYESLKEETFRLIKQKPELFIPYFNPDLVDKKGQWKTLVFYFWSLKNKAVISESPLFEKILKTIPNLTSAAISVLEADTEIAWHTGDTDGILRCHLPVFVPSPLPKCGFQVNDEKRSWKESEFLIFCDAHKHKAFNHTSQNRITLIIDIINPQFLRYKKRIIRNSLSIMYLQKIELKIPLVRRMPSFVRTIIRRICVIFLYFYLPFKRQ